jgi:CRISP-associated protein Cas1
MILHYFNYYGYYAGSFYPREHYNSGFMILKQVEHYQDNQKRLLIAKKIVKGAAKNTLKILKYHNRRGKNIKTPIEEIEGFYQLSMEQENIEQLMAFEGQIKQTYFKAFSTIIDNPEFQFESRTRRPPKDYVITKQPPPI